MSSSKPKILVTREVFDETLDYLREHAEVQANQGDAPFSPAALAAALAGKDGLMCCLTDRVDAALLAAAPGLRAVANIAAFADAIAHKPAYVTRGAEGRGFAELARLILSRRRAAGRPQA